MMRFCEFQRLHFILILQKQKAAKTNESINDMLVQKQKGFDKRIMTFSYYNSR